MDETRALLRSMDLGISQTDNLFTMMDTDRSGSVEVDEFVDCLMRTRGVMATVTDGHACIIELIERLLMHSGAKTAADFTCPCGNIFMADSRFCRKCGEPRPST